MKDDLIRRSDAIKAIEELPNAYNGWSDTYDKAYIIGTLEEVPRAEQTEPNCSEKPNNCEPQYEMGMGTLKCDNCSEYGSFKCAKCDGEMYFKRLEPKDEPQTEEWYTYQDEQEYNARHGKE